MAQTDWTFDSTDQTWTLQGRDCHVWMQRRPHYCDRGQWLAHVEVTGDHLAVGLDSADGWPRYYFVLSCALSECEAWMTRRGQWAPHDPANGLDDDMAAMAQRLAQIVHEPDRLCATCQHPARNHTLGRCRKHRCGCGGWRG